ncbi:MAG: peptidylprolyl isomerase [Gammaproteobacteria bacterium]|jgi:peptidyl-prolyl cis-trans isomerase SurA
MKTSFCNYYFRKIHAQVFAAFMLLIFSSVLPAAAPDKSNSIDRVVAIVNDDVITYVELELEVDTIKQQLLQRQTQLPPADILQKQVLDRLVVNRIQLQYAEKRLLKVDDETLNKAIENIARQNGLGINEFRRALEASGLSYKDYRNRIRDEMVIARLQQREVIRKISVTDQEIEDFLANQDLQGRDKEEYHLQHILLVVPEAAAPERIQAVKQKAQQLLSQLNAGEDFAQLAIAQSDGQQALNGGDLGWRKLAEIPTLFSGLVVNMNVGDISSLIRSPSGFHIVKLTDKRSSDAQHIVNQTLTRHILIQTSDLVSSDEALEKAQQLKQRIDGGEDFIQIATANSGDKASAAEGGSLGWVNPGTMVKEFEDAMNRLQPGEVSDPIRTQFGWHLILVEERRQHDNTEEFQKKQAREYILEQKTGPALENWIRQIRDESFVKVRL